MAYRISQQEQDMIAPSRKTAPVKRAAYLAFIRSLPCVITRQHGVEAAHLSFARPELGHFGRGKSQKASDRWCLPLSPSFHAAQHAAGNERRWWMDYAPDPHVACMILWGLYSDYGMDAREHAEHIIMKGIAQ